MRKKKLLLIDSEGGHGGSSKSLFALVKYINKKKISMKVLCKKESWIKEEYRKIGVKCYVVTSIPSYTVLDTYIKNIYSLIIFAFNQVLFFLTTKKKITQHFKNYNLIHLNHSNLWLLAIWIKMVFPQKKITAHIRTLPYNNLFSKLQYKILYKFSDQLIFITENEYDYFKKLTGLSPSKNIIYNSVEKIKTYKKKYSYLNKDIQLTIGSFSNYSYYRGTDRIIEVASLLSKEVLKKIKFVIAGDTNISNNAKRKLKYLKSFKTLEQLVNKQGLKKNFYFLGHINDVENVLVNLDITLKLTREYNPWGRDILESMFYKVPAISIGTYDVFVKNNYSGVLFPEYNAQKVANEIIYFLKNKDKLQSLKRNSRKIISMYCNPNINGKKIEDIWLKM